jgi:hypothetical protein
MKLIVRNTEFIFYKMDQDQIVAKDGSNTEYYIPRHTINSYQVNGHGIVRRNSCPKEFDVLLLAVISQLETKLNET